MTRFHELVEKRIEDPRGKLTHLIKYTKVDPKEIIKYWIQQLAVVGYDNAKELLEKSVEILIAS